MPARHVGAAARWVRSQRHPAEGGPRQPRGPDGRPRAVPSRARLCCAGTGFGVWSAVWVWVCLGRSGARGVDVIVGGVVGFAGA